MTSRIDGAVAEVALLHTAIRLPIAVHHDQLFHLSHYRLNTQRFVSGLQDQCLRMG